MIRIQVEAPAALPIEDEFGRCLTMITFVKPNHSCPTRKSGAALPRRQQWRLRAGLGPDISGARNEATLCAFPQQNEGCQTSCNNPSQRLCSAVQSPTPNKQQRKNKADEADEDDRNSVSGRRARWYLIVRVTRRFVGLEIIRSRGREKCVGTQIETGVNHQQPKKCTLEKQTC